FGYPQAHEDDAHRVVRAGLGIVEAMGRLNAGPQDAPGVRLAVRVGIHTGLVVVGELGVGATREAMAIVGESANVAARVQALADPNTIITSADTYRLIQGFFDCKPLGPQPLKGLSHPLEVYQVVQESAARSRLDVVGSTALTPLVGRAQELGLLLECWEHTKDGMGQVVVVRGEAGIGKSRLVQALKEDVARDPQAWLTPCQCSPYHENSALYPLIDLLQRVVLQYEKNEPAQEKLSKLEGWLVQYGFSLPETVPLFASLLSLPLGDGYAPLRLSPEQQKAQTLQALLEVLLERAAQQPLLFVVEDVHWVDASTLELLNLVVDQVPTTRILALFTCRPSFSPTWIGRSSVTQINLNRLTQRQVVDVVHGVTRGKLLPAEMLEQVVAKTDGVPLFVEELTKMVLESGLLQERNERYELTGPLPPLAIPTTLHDSLMARLDRLATIKELAQLSATLGREFSYELLRAIASPDEGTLQRDLTQLVEAELLYQRGMPPQATYVFKHALIQETAYQSMLKSKRQQVHQRIAQVLAERFPETTASQPELLAHHYTEADLPEQAIGYWERAGQRAIERSANVEAIAHLTKGLELLRTLPDSPEHRRQELDFRLMLGPVLTATKGYAAPEVGATFRRAQELSEEVGDTSQLFRALRVGWAYHAVAGGVQRSRELAEQLLAMAHGAHDSALIVDAERMLGSSLFYLGELDGARAHLEAGIALYDPTTHHRNALLYGQDPAIVGRGYAAVTWWCCGYPDRGSTRAQEALDPALAPSHPFSRLFALILGAWLHQCRGDIRGAESQAEEAIRLATELRSTMWLAGATVLRGWARAAQGQAADGIAEIREALAAHQATGARLITPYYLALLADAYARGGQSERGLAAVAEAHTLVQETEERWCEAELLRLRGELLVGHATPDEQQAETCFRQALDLARSQSARSWELRAALSLSRLWQKLGKCDAARQMVAEIYGRFTEGFDTADLREARELLDEVS
ncbi:MAG: AAA family ATPase, partial [Chloroflexota bacterium]|nr:AAA family ATPase [Chloroflexota bacterium]